MTKIFQYSVLQYVHSQILGERLNLGLVFYFPQENRVIFKGFDRFKKYKSLYKSYPEEAITEYLTSFAKASTGLTSDVNEGAPFSRLLSEYFVTEESAPLQFNEIKTGVLYTSDIDKIVNDFYTLFLKELGIKPLHLDYSNELIHKGAPIQEFKTFLAHRLSNYKTVIDTKTVLRVENIIFKPDLIWKNGSTNVVKGIAFSKSEEHIIDTALLINKKLDSLKHESKSKNYRFDLLVQKPADEKLYKHFLNAIEILNQIEAPKGIIPEERIIDYANYAVDSIQNHNDSNPPTFLRLN